MLTSSSAFSTQVGEERFDPKNIKTQLEGKLDQKNVNDQQSHRHTTLHGDSVRAPVGGLAKMVAFFLKTLWEERE